MDTPKTNTNKRVIFITGGAGYIGEMLCDQFSKRDDVAEIIALDKEPQSEFSKSLAKVTYIEQNMADDGWQEIVAKKSPDTVIHAAWQIRAMYGKADEEWRWNVTGSKNVFEFAFNTPSVQKLIHFSTASSYSARVDNSVHHRFSESELLRDDDYIYAKEKKAAEDELKKVFDIASANAAHAPQVFIVRPAAITGPRGRYMRNRFGLQSALSGNLKGGVVNKMVTALTSFVPATRGWVRQFIHEDDVADIIALFTFSELPGKYDVFNITPPGEPVFAADMARVVGKKMFIISPQLVRIAFFTLWHLTRGRIPTTGGSWRYYSYPLVMDGTKLTRTHGYNYVHSSGDAFEFTDGRYASFVPADKIHLKGK